MCGGSPFGESVFRNYNTGDSNYEGHLLHNLSWIDHFLSLELFNHI
jgi:hypothetical protein